jgi:hypothetical protein
MDFKFDQLITQSIKRLTRPKVSNDFPTFYDHKAFNNMEGGFHAELIEVI